MKFRNEKKNVIINMPVTCLYPGKEKKRRVRAQGWDGFGQTNVKMGGRSSNLSRKGGYVRLQFFPVTLSVCL